MGCDGGTIPKRHELVKTAQKKEVKCSVSNRNTTYSFCALSKLPLKQPVVACFLGKLYNRQAILEYLINPQQFGDANEICGHIKQMNHVVNLNLKENDKTTSSSTSVFSSNSTKESQEISPFICPITLKEMNGNQRFCFLASCGCVLSEQAIKEIPSKECINCNKPFNATTSSDYPTDIIPINIEEKVEFKTLKDNMFKRYEILEKIKIEKKKSKKAKKLAKDSIEILPTDKAVGEVVEKIRNKSSKKRKPNASGSDDEQQAKKKIDKPIHRIINVNLPSEIKAMNKSGPIYQSAAIKSLYNKKDENPEDAKKRSNWITMGTFNRYSSFN